MWYVPVVEVAVAVVQKSEKDWNFYKLVFPTCLEVSHRLVFPCSSYLVAIHSLLRECAQECRRLPPRLRWNRIPFPHNDTQTYDHMNYQTEFRVYHSKERSMAAHPKYFLHPGYLMPFQDQDHLAVQNSLALRLVQDIDVLFRLLAHPCTRHTCTFWTRCSRP